MWSHLALVLGVLLAAAVVVDAFSTIMGAGVPGPLTRSWVRPAWRALLALHRRRPVHGVLALTGPVVVVLTILVWYVLPVLSACLVFAGDHRVVGSPTGIPADHARTLYFVTTTLTGVGFGDLVPDGWPWTVIATTYALTTTIILTISLSYVLSVLGAAIGRRTMASGITALGADPASVVRHTVLDDPSGAMHARLVDVSSAVSDAAARQASYPVLRYFHAADADESAAPAGAAGLDETGRAPRPCGPDEGAVRREGAAGAVGGDGPVEGEHLPAVLRLADAWFLMTRLDDAIRPGPGLLGVIRSAVTDFAEVRRAPGWSVPGDAGDDHLREQARTLGIVTDADFERARAGYRPLRDELVAACHDDGHPPR